MLLVLFTPIRITDARALQVQKNDTFTIHIHTHLSGQTGDYDDYTEDEYDDRLYTALSVNGTAAEWMVYRNYSYHDSEDGHSQSTTTHHFYVNTTSGEYINHTMDSPRSYLQYYTYDNIWFQIDPTLPVGSTVHILGYDYTVIGNSTVFVDLVTAVDTIAVSLTGSSQHFNDPDYGSGGIDAVVDETFYYDPITGYIVAYDWVAHCSTSLGDFKWVETGVVTKSSYPLQYNAHASQMRIVLYVVATIVSVAIVLAIREVYVQTLKKRVKRAVAMISGEVPPPTAAGEAPTLWNPLTLDYHSLLENPPETDAVGFGPGIFLTIEPDNRVAVVNTRVGHELRNTVFQLQPENMWLLYKLALGMMASGSPDYSMLVVAFPGLEYYLEPATEIAGSDPHAVEVFTKLTGVQSVVEAVMSGQKTSGVGIGASPEIPDEDAGELASIIQLMARRKVMDYSLGQAPLSPRSHWKKLKTVLKYTPSSVLLVGDDDLLSISLARRNIEVTLLEIDPYTCALVAYIAERENLPIHIYQTDLREPLPADIRGNFDLFVGDPDFTIEAFTLFLSRGLSLIRQGGIGLINYERSFPQELMSSYLLDLLDVELVEKFEEPWDYVIVRNISGGTTSGKYSSVSYTKQIVLNVAPFESIMYVVRRTPETQIILDRSDRLLVPDSAIYDL